MPEVNLELRRPNRHHRKTIPAQKPKATAKIRYDARYWRTAPKPSRRLEISKPVASAIRLLVVAMTRGRPITLTVNERGQWRTRNREVSKLLNTLFHADRYRPSLAYCPNGRAVAVAIDVADILGAELDITQRQPAPQSDRNGNQMVY